MLKKQVDELIEDYNKLADTLDLPKPDSLVKRSIDNGVKQPERLIKSDNLKDPKVGGV